MLSLRTALTALLVMVASGVVLDHVQAQTAAQFSGLIPRQVNALLDRYQVELNAVLRTRLPEEKKFVDDVVDEIRAGVLPKPIVDSSWLWIRKNRPYTNYPFVYFERILRLQGDKFGYPIPPFDRNIYSSRYRRLADESLQRIQQRK